MSHETEADLTNSQLVRCLLNVDQMRPNRVPFFTL
jgi:hypothetical protein